MVFSLRRSKPPGVADRAAGERPPTPPPSRRRRRHADREESPTAASATACVRFFSCLSYRLSTAVVHDVQLDQLVGEQLQGPARTPLRWAAARDGDEAGFLRTIQFWHALLRTRPTRQRRLHPFFAQPLAQPMDRRHPDVKGLPDFRVRPARTIHVRLQDHPGTPYLGRRHTRLAKEILQHRPLLLRQPHNVLCFPAHGLLLSHKVWNGAVILETGSTCQYQFVRPLVLCQINSATGDTVFGASC